MKKSVRVITAICSIIAFFGSLFWYRTEGGYEPFIGIFASLSTLIVTLFLKEKKKFIAPNINMTQAAGNNSTQYQSGRDMKINE